MAVYFVVNACDVPKMRVAYLVGAIIRADGNGMIIQNKTCRAVILAFTLLLSACATARMHSVDELNSASLACGLTYGELIQDEEAKKLLILFRASPTPEHRRCVYQYARRNHLKMVVIDSIQFPEEGH